MSQRASGLCCGARRSGTPLSCGSYVLQQRDAVCQLCVEHELAIERRRLANRFEDAVQVAGPVGCARVRQGASSSDGGLLHASILGHWVPVREFGHGCGSGRGGGGPRSHARGAAAGGGGRRQLWCGTHRSRRLSHPGDLSAPTQWLPARPLPGRGVAQTASFRRRGHSSTLGSASRWLLCALPLSESAAFWWQLGCCGC